MISGPTIPNTLQSLCDLVVSRMDLIEHGLRVLSEDLVLGGDAAVDLFACDASGVPVLIYFAVPDSSVGLPARVLGAQAWLRRNGAFLASEIADPQLRHEAEPRFLVLGLDIYAETLEDLKRTGLPSLTVAQICSLTLGGRLRVGLTTLYESDLCESEATPQQSEPDGFQVPSGIVDPMQRSLAGRFLDLARRVDSGLTASGDRFSRRLHLGGRCIALLGLQSGQLCVEFPALGEGFEEAFVELTEESCLSAVDRMLRLVLAMELAIDRPATDPVDPHSRTEFDIGTIGPEPMSAGSSPRESSRPELSEDRFSLEPIRRSVAKAQLSREEFSALGEDGSDS